MHFGFDIKAFLTVNIKVKPNRCMCKASACRQSKYKFTIYLILVFIIFIYTNKLSNFIL